MIISKHFVVGTLRLCQCLLLSVSADVANSSSGSWGFLFPSVLMDLLFVPKEDLGRFSIYLFFSHLFVPAHTHGYLVSSLGYDLISLFILLLNFARALASGIVQVGSCARSEPPPHCLFVLFRELPQFLAPQNVPDSSGVFCHHAGISRVSGVLQPH